MKKLIMSIMLTFAIGYGLAIAQSGYSTQTQDQSKSKQKSGVMSAQDPAGWQKIGEKTFDLSKGHDELAFNAPEKLKSIRVKTEDAAVDITKLQLYYDTGDKQEVSIEAPIIANSESQVINLNETNHGLKKIVFDFKSSKNMTSSSKDMKSNDKMKSLVKVEIWGLKSETSMK